MAGTVLSAYFLAALLTAASNADKKVEIPSVFDRRNEVKHCENNAIVHAWCDSNIFEDLECGVLPDADLFACKCVQDPSKCPGECVGGSEHVEKTHYSITCRHIPMDSPNYILKEYHEMHGCENNAKVAAWCDDYVNKHVECALYPQLDQYLCSCSGVPNHVNANCPDECIDGSEPLIRTLGSVLCSGIPEDSPNYILKET